MLAEEILEEEITMQLEDLVLRYFQNKEIKKERDEENKMIFEEIEHIFENSDKEEIAFQLSNGEFAILHKKALIKEILDKDSLSFEARIDKAELKTPFDFSILTRQNKISPELITKHTHTDTIVKTKISKKKNQPRKKKRGF